MAAATALAVCRLRGASSAAGRSGPGRLRAGAEGQARDAGADGHGLRPGAGLGRTTSSTEVEGWGGTFETRDPNWSVEAGAQAITEAISSDPKPDVLVVHSPDLNSYSKLFKKAQADGIYVVLIDNPANFPADAFIGSDWDRLGQLEAEAAVKGCGEELLQEDRPGAGRPGQRLEPLSICRHHEGAGEASRISRWSPSRISNWDATTSRNVTTTMLQQNPDICVDHRLLGRRRHRRCRRDPRRRHGGQDRSWSPPAAAKRSTATSCQDGYLRRGRDDRAAEPVARHERHHQVPAAERPAAPAPRRPTSTRSRRPRPRPTSSPTPAGI